MMDNTVFNIESFIYKNNNSISEELCEEIINKLEAITKERRYGCEIDTTIYWNKINKFLSLELRNNLMKYNDMFSERILISNNMINFRMFNIDSSLCKNKFKIEKNNDLIEQYDKICNDGMSYNFLLYFWFLNDSESEYIICDSVKIKHTAGKLLLIPLSWIFPLKENILLSSINNKYIISGVLSNSL
jgi:hypothetical protein